MNVKSLLIICSIVLIITSCRILPKKSPSRQAMISVSPTSLSMPDTQNDVARASLK